MPALAARCASWCDVALALVRSQGPGSGYRGSPRARRADASRLRALDGRPVLGARDGSGSPYILEHFPPWAGTIAPDSFEIICVRCGDPGPDAVPVIEELRALRGPYRRHADACAALTEHLARLHARELQPG
jgi:hypothetical protein